MKKFPTLVRSSEQKLQSSVVFLQLLNSHSHEQRPPLTPPTNFAMLVVISEEWNRVSFNHPVQTPDKWIFYGRSINQTNDIKVQYPDFSSLGCGFLKVVSHITEGASIRSLRRSIYHSKTKGEVTWVRGIVLILSWIRGFGLRTHETTALSCVLQWTPSSSSSDSSAVDLLPLLCWALCRRLHLPDESMSESLFAYINADNRNQSIKL